jgi:hypothetical protein
MWEAIIETDLAAATLDRKACGRTRSVVYTGDSHGDDWTATCELAPEGVAA